MKRSIRVALSFATLATACEHPGTPAVRDEAPTAPVVATVRVTPSVVRLLVSDTVQLTAVARTAGGDAVSGVTFTWASRNPNATAVSSSGLARALPLSAGIAEDSTWIVVTAASFSDSARIVIADPAPPVTSNPAFRLGTNLDQLNDWTTEWAFTDLFRESRSWISNRTGAAWGQGGALPLTSDQWVRSLESGQWATSIVLTDGTGHQPGGDYVLLWDGDGEVSFDRNPGVTTLTTAANRVTARLAPATPAFLALRRTNPANPVRNVRVMAAANESNYLTAPFNADFLRVVRPFGVIRFMNWQAMNRNPPHEWGNRSTTSFATYAGPWGAPVETMVALANETGADAWFCMPHNATDDYMRQFAMVVRARLGSQRKVYVELSNEFWNGLFPQSAYARDRGQALGLSQDRFQAALRWQSQRSVEMFRIWREVFGPDSARVVRVLASQAATPWTAEQLLGWQDAFRRTDVIAIAPYFGGRFGGRDGARESTMSETELLNELMTEIETTTRGMIESNARVAQTYGVKLVAYEGGQHLVSADVLPQYEAAVTRLFTGANRNARMGDLYRRYFEIWYGAGGDLFMNFVTVASYGRYGSWGNLEYVHQDPATSPKWRAVMDAIARWGRR